MKKLIECVPNFSEGNDMHIIDTDTDAMKTVEGISVIDVDPGKATNRTVVTMVGEPEPICEAAFRAVKKAAELIDMTKHKGAHPRFGATDVCPLVPVSNITMEETVEYAGTNCCSSGLGSPAIQFTGTEIRMPLFTGKTFSQSFIFSGPTSS